MPQLTFNPLDPREVADTINLLRLLGAIDAAVGIEVMGEPTLTEAEARKQMAEVTRRYSMWRGAEPQPAPTPTRLAGVTLDLGDL